jgi:hypothetical protein
VRRRDPKWVRTMLERTARQFLAFEVASCRRHDAAAAERRASRALRRPAALLARIPDMAAAAGIIAEVAAAAQTRATPSRGGRRADVNRDWLFEQSGNNAAARRARVRTVAAMPAAADRWSAF